MSQLLKALAHPANQAILTLLAAEPTYARRISGLTGLSESDVTRRLRALERLGILEGSWQHLGKNVKVYGLTARRIQMDVGPGGVEISMGARAPVRIEPFPMQVPEATNILGYEPERDILAGDAPVVLVEGIAGSGKTTLLAEAALAAGDPFWHSCTGLETTEYLANRMGVFLAARGQKDLLAAVEAGMDAMERRQRILAAFDQPGVTWAFDDIHRAEGPVADILADAAQTVRRGRLLMGGRQVLRPANNPDAKVVRLDGWSDDAVEACFAASSIPVPDLDRVRQEVGGHPLALRLFLDTCRQQNVLPDALLDRVPEADLQAYLLQEVDKGLSDTERRVLGIASLYRQTFAQADIARIVTGRVQGAMAKLQQRGLITPVGTGFRLHEVIRNYFASRVHDARTMHATIAKRLLSAGGLEARLEALHHFVEAGRPQDALGIIGDDMDLADYGLIDAGYHRLYADILARFDQDSAGKYWGQVLDERGDLAVHAGNHDAALELYDQALEFLPKRRRADLAWKRALCLEACQRKEEALVVLEEAKPEPGSRDERRVLELRRRLA